MSQNFAGKTICIPAHAWEKNADVLWVALKIGCFDLEAKGEYIIEVHYGSKLFEIMESVFTGFLVVSKKR